VAVANADGGATPDVLSSGSVGSDVGAVSFLRGIGDGSFAGAVSYDTGAAPYGLAIGDFNGDGKADAATADYAHGVVCVLLGDGAGAFAPKVEFAVDGNPYSIALADMNGDGGLDVLTANYNDPGTVSVLLNACPGTGDGGLTAADTGRALQAAAGIRETPAADLERFDLIADQRITLEDVAGIARKVAGLAP
jgi:hypothetical protein